MHYDLLWELLIYTTQLQLVVDIEKIAVNMKTAKLELYTYNFHKKRSKYRSVPSFWTELHVSYTRATGCYEKATCKDSNAYATHGGVSCVRATCYACEYATPKLRVSYAHASCCVSVLVARM